MFAAFMQIKASERGAGYREGEGGREREREGM